jgi:hypothetical protein
MVHRQSFLSQRKDPDSTAEQAVLKKGSGKRGQEEILDTFLGHGTAAGYD